MINSSQIEETTKVKNITVYIGNNPIQCDCYLVDFIQYKKKKITNESNKYIKFKNEDI